MNDFLLPLTKERKISQNTYNNLHISAAVPGILYGLPKVHKANNPLRPIMSAINTYNYKLAKFLVPILQPIACNEYTINSTQEFANFIKTLRYEGNMYLASFDVTSLFTNIPTEETIKITLDSLWTLLQIDIFSIYFVHV